MKLFWKRSEYEIVWHTYVELMLILKSKPTLEIEKIYKIDWFNLYFLVIVFVIIESWIIKSRFQLSKINCDMFNIEKLIENISKSDFYSKNLIYSKDNQKMFIEELSGFIYDNLLLYYDKFTYNDIDYKPNDIDKQKRIKLIGKWINKALNNKTIVKEAYSFVFPLSEHFYNYSKIGEETTFKDIVIKYLNNIYEK